MLQIFGKTTFSSQLFFPENSSQQQISLLASEYIKRTWV